MKQEGQVITFDSQEEFEAWQAEQDRKAQEGVLPEQEEITFGDLAVKFDTNTGLVIWGEIWTYQDYLDAEAEDCSDEEVKQVEAQIRAEYLRGYRFGRWYSKDCPEGELGAVHVVTLWKTTPEAFDWARNHDWNITDEEYDRVSGESEDSAVRNGKVSAEDAHRARAEQTILIGAGKVLVDHQEEAHDTESFEWGVVWTAMEILSIHPDSFADVQKAVRDIARVMRKAKE